MLHDAESATRQINLSRKSCEKLSIRLIVASCLSKKANSVCEEQRYLGFLERTKNKRQKRERPLPRFALGRFTKMGGPGLFAKCQNSKSGLKDFSVMPMTRQSNLPGSSCFYFCLRSLSKRCIIVPLGHEALRSGAFGQEIQKILVLPLCQIERKLLY